MSQDAPTESGESSHADISPSRFDSDGIDVSGAPAVVTWHETDGDTTMRHLSHFPHDHLTLQIHRDASSNTAFFQLKANVAFKARRDRTNVLLSIQPERIRALALVERDGSEYTAASKLGTTTYCLRFDLDQAPSLIVPQGDLTPKHKHSRLVMDSLRGLAKKITFCVDLPSSTLSKARLVSLCESVSSGNVRSTPRFMDIASLYGGKGGRIIEHASQSAQASGSAPAFAGPEAESPPSYDDLGMSNTRPAASQKSGTKRRRINTPDDTPSEKPRECVAIGMEGVCKMMMERIENGFNEIGSRLDRMERRLTGLERSVEHHAEKLGFSIEGVHQRSSEQADELRGELDRGLYDVRKEIDDTVTVRVEDEMYVARDQLEDFVKDEVKNAEERLEDRLEESLNSANVSLDFSWNR
ncbi:hypothetical protein N0V82_004316 [Gnomoniopsis sp. IMI 355080]|nr:hypothetical protein N0V82_004316 [Gnomoniopsis sp. IMI 355080]